MKAAVLALVTACAAADPAARALEPPLDAGLARESGRLETWDTPPAPAVEGGTAPTCTAIIASEPMPVDCAATHGLMWCAGRGPNGCVPCPVEAVDGGVTRRLDCDGNAANGCEVLEGDEHCGACEVVCPAAQHCVNVWAASTGFAPHCE
jgi:hypothetical protein